MLCTNLNCVTHTGELESAAAAMTQRQWLLALCLILALGVACCTAQEQPTVITGE
jgi:hypothetical protein